MLVRITFIFLFSCFSLLEAVPKKPDYVSKDTWDKVYPYLLPDNHPTKQFLDEIFKESCILNGVTLYQAGFRYTNNKNPKKVTVARHPKLPGYIIKLFLDNQPVGEEWCHWLQRIEGANLIRETIEEKAYTASFKVPQKWIYYLPCRMHTVVGRFCIMIVEDMQIHNHSENRKQWKSNSTYEQVYMYWDLLETLGLFDSVYIDNIPYCKDGRYAFVDTEHYLKWPIDYAQFNRYLRDGKLQFWKQLTGQECKQSKAMTE